MSQTLCRNIIIHGSCKYQDKGCIFNHNVKRIPSQATTTLSVHSSAAEMAKKRFNVDSPSFQPSTGISTVTAKGPTLSPKVAGAAPFIPKSPPRQSETEDVAEQLQSEMDTLQFDSLPAPYQQEMPLSMYQSPNDMYFPQSTAYQQPLRYHLYASLPPDTSNYYPYQKSIHDFFISDAVREELQRKSASLHQTLPMSGLPKAVDKYHSLVPLDISPQKSVRVFGYPTSAFKVSSNLDGKVYALWRVESFRLANERSINAVRKWKDVVSPNTVAVHEAFTSHAFGDNSLIFIFDFYPMSSTLYDAHFGRTGLNLQPKREVPLHQVAEKVLWGYVSQITSALNTIHNLSLSARLIDAKKILLTAKMRIRLNCCSILDVIHPEDSPLLERQQKDFQQFGRLMLMLSCHSFAQTDNVESSLGSVASSYSFDFHNLLTYLLSNEGERSIGQILRISAPYILQNLELSFNSMDTMESQLMGELENSRLVRLLCKLGFINERPELDREVAWSEVGDKYIIKLFRDYVFHQVNDHGIPVIDMSHVVACLNKLDAGSEEKITLVTRDEETCIIVSYRELKVAIAGAFQELTRH